MSDQLNPAVAQPMPAMAGAMAPGTSGLVRIATPGALDSAMAAEAQAQEQERQEFAKSQLKPAQAQGLAGHIRNEFEMMRRHRQSSAGWNERILTALRAFRGEYEPEQLAAIRQFGGSEVYARIIAAKCRGASAMLREIYLGGSRSWRVAPTPQPELPEEIGAEVDKLVALEAVGLMGHNGGPPLEADVMQRRQGLMAEAEKAAREKARKEAKAAERRLDDLLVEGGFYSALAQFLQDLPLYPFACIKGPVVRVVPDVKWENRKAVVKQTPRMFWERVNPADLWFTPGASSIAQANVIERQRLSRADLNALIDLPGYDSEALLGILNDFTRGHTEAMADTTDQTRADAESRESPSFNDSGMFDCLEYHGSVQGKMLIDAGIPKSKIPDERRDYAVQAWMIADRVIKVQMTPSPRSRHPYFVTSFEKMPGTVIGNALPDILSDIQDVLNATLRALVNNLSISSGPQVVVNVDMLDDTENPDEMYPWKRWRTRSPAYGSAPGGKVIEFYQPESRAQELLGIYEKLTQIADELSAIPRYLTGSERTGGAGRTASGLAMLMNNASKVLQTVAANIDMDVFEPLLQMLYDIVMLTDSDPTQPGALRGDESIEVKGVSVAMQRETERQRQIEMLQATANPMDAKIMGPRGRAQLLRTIAETLGIEAELIVPPDEEIAAMEKAERAMQAALAAGGGAGALPLPGPEGADAAASEGAGGVGGGGGLAPAPAASPATLAGQGISQLGRAAQGAQQGGENTRPRAPGPRVNLAEQLPRRAA